MFKCKGCEERKVGCHSCCESYKEERKRLDETNERKFKEIQTLVGIEETNYRGVRRAMKRRGKKC